MKIDLDLPIEEKTELDILAGQLASQVLNTLSREIEFIATESGMDDLAKGYLCQRVFACLSGEVNDNTRD
jgi:hypothetical protein